MEAYDISNTGIVSCGTLPIKRIFSTFSEKYYDKRSFPSDTIDGILVGGDGLEDSYAGVPSQKPYYNDNILCYMVAHNTGFDNPDLHSYLMQGAKFDGHGFYVRKDNYLQKMPVFCATRYITYNRSWTERARIMKSADGADRFNADVASGKLDQWLRKCLLFTCLEMQNHMRTFTGSDGRFYRNELCLDTTNGDTLASVDVSKLNANADEKQLLAQWESLMAEVKKTAEYNSSLTYGVYQIFAEIDTSYKDDDGNTIWNNLEVHSALQTLKSLVKEYYNKEIVPTLFEYEFLK